MTITSDGGTDISLTAADDLIFNDAQLSSAVQMTDADASLPNSNTGIVDAINDAWNAATGGSGSLWTRTGTSLSPTTITDQVSIGSNAETVHALEVTGAKIGKALVVFDETGDQNIFTASASGTPKFVITHAGDVGIGTTNPLQKLQLTLKVDRE